MTTEQARDEQGPSAVAEAAAHRLRPLGALLLALASATMLCLSLPGYEAWYLSFVSLVPLLVVLQRATPRTALLAWWLAGLLFFLFAVSWLSHLTPVGMAALAIYLSLSFPVFAAAARMATTGRPRLLFVVAVPILWVSVEMLRGIPLGGFCWHYIGHNFYRWTSFIQISDFTGVYGVSFVVVAVNVVVARAVHIALSGEMRGRLARRRLPVACAAAVALVLASLAYGRFRIAETRPVQGPVVSVVQGNIPQELREVAASVDWTWKEILEKRNAVFDKYDNLTRPLLKSRDDLVVWPETIVSPLEGEITREKNYSAETEKRVRALRADLGRPFLVGSTRFAWDDNTLIYFNAAYFFPAVDGPFEVYCKIYPVPFGEFIPFREVRWFNAFVQWLTPKGYEANLTAGAERILFAVKGVRFATPICYEDTKPSLIREFRMKGARFVVNLTNDGWFRDTAELDQHMANSVFRTVENRIGLVRSANTGISAFITPTGVITSFIKDKHDRYRLVEGVLTDTVVLDDRRTFYTANGDVFGWCAVIFATVFLAGSGAVRILRRSGS